MTVSADLFRGLHVYLCGDTSGENAKAEYEQAEGVARRLGAVSVTNPYKHLSMYAYRTEAQRLRWKLHALTTGELSAKDGGGYDLVLLLKSWQNSKAAYQEAVVADWCGIRIAPISPLLERMEPIV